MKLNFWPFNRNKKDDANLPEEVKDYYQAEKRERAGVAGLLAVGTLLVTVLLALGLFFGGRWLYRTVFDNDNQPTETAEQRGEGQQEVGSGAQDDRGDDQASQGGDQQGTQGTSTLPGDESPTPTPTQTPNTGPLPRTGPELDL